MSELLAAGDTRLAPDRDPAALRALLEDYTPRDREQALTRSRMLAFLVEHPDALERTSPAGHFTASALVLDDRRERALLTHHVKLGLWLQIGGHCDGDANAAGVALREVREESGLADVRIDPRPVDLDIHPIPERPGEPEHLHLDVRFLAYAPAQADPRPNHESLAMAWFGPHDLGGLHTDASVRRLFGLAFGLR